MVVLVGLLAVACGADKKRQSTPDESGQSLAEKGPATLSVYTVNYPLQYFAERIGGDFVEVTCPAPPDVDPAYWAPSAEQIAGYQQADLILLNGAGYAKWLGRATLPTGKLVDTSAAIQERLLPLDEGLVHSHGPEGEHSHKGYAFTTWLDLQLAIEQARAVKEAFVSALPEQADNFQASLDSLTAKMVELDGRLESLTARIGDQPLLFSHPVYQYLTARYGLNGRSVHWEPDEAPTQEQWLELEAILVDHPAQWMIWEGEPLEDTARRLVDVGIQSIVYDPGANAPSGGNLLSLMEENATSLAAIGGQE